LAATRYLEGRAVAETRAERRLVAPGVTWRLVRERGLAGILFLPPGLGPHPAVVTLTGSGGGLRFSREWGALLAPPGYAALALAYFNYEDLPRLLEGIPLEYFGTAIHWLREQPEVRGDRLPVMGISRGGELAQLLGATHPELTAVVGYVPSGIVHATPGIGMAAWTHHGEPVPYLFPPDARERHTELLLGETVILAS
jgi:dienelactone hydrolase